MKVSDDERPTPERGLPVQPEPRRRVRTPPLGVPVGRESARELPSLADYEAARVYPRARSRADSDVEMDSQDEVPTDSLDARIAAGVRREIKRRLRAYRVILGIVATLASGAGGGAIKSAIDGARASERQLVRIEILERDLERLQNRLEPPRREPLLVPSATTAASPKGTP